MFSPRFVLSCYRDCVYIVELLSVKNSARNEAESFPWQVDVHSVAVDCGSGVQRARQNVSVNWKLNGFQSLTRVVLLKDCDIEVCHCMQRRLPLVCLYTADCINQSLFFAPNCSILINLLDIELYRDW